MSTKVNEDGLIRSLPQASQARPLSLTSQWLEDVHLQQASAHWGSAVIQQASNVKILRSEAVSLRIELYCPVGEGGLP